MKVKELMVRNVKTCAPETGLAGAAATLKSADCGILPVVDSHRRLVGVLTDRDICMAAVRPRPITEFRVGDVMTRDVHTCTANDTVRTALNIMAGARVSRLPVVGNNWMLEGLLSLTDVLLALNTPGAERPDMPAQDHVVVTARAVARRRKAGSPR